MNAFSEDSTPHIGARRGRRMRPRPVRIGVFLTFVLSVGMVVAPPPVDAEITTACVAAIDGVGAALQQLPSPPSPISSEFARAVIDAVDHVIAECAADTEEDLGDGFFAEIERIRFLAENWLNCAEIGAIATEDLTCTVPAGMRVVVPAGQRLDTFVLLLNYGVLENHGVVSVGARGLIFENFGTIDNHGVIDIGPVDQHPLVPDQLRFGSLSNHGTLNNEGTVRTHGDLIDLNSDLSTLQYGLLFNDGTINSSGDLIIAGGYISSEADGSVANDGTITNTSQFVSQGTFDNNGTITNDLLFVSAGTFDNNGTITNDLLFVSAGTFDNNGSIVSSDSSTFVNQPGGTFNNRSALDIYGRFSIGGTLNNASTINIFGIVGNDGVLHNDGTVHIDPRNEEDLSNYLLPDGTILPFPFFQNFGTVEQDCDAVFSGAASWQFDGIAPVDVCVVEHRLEVLSEPCVVYSSQDAVAAGLDGTMLGGDVRTVQVTGSLSGQGGASSCVPAGASSVVFRVSSVDPLTEGNLRMTPAGVVATGGAGVVNYGAANGLNNANTVTVPVSASGAVDIEANAGPAGTVPTTDVRLVAIGFYSPDVVADLKFVSVNPCAVADSRGNKNANDVFDGPADDGFWTVGDAFPDVDVVGDFDFGQGGLNGVGNPAGNPSSCGVPANADAVWVNVVAIAPTGSGFLSVGTGGTDPIAEATTPFAALSPGMANGATTIVNLNGQDKIAVDIDGAVGAKVKVRVEVLGYFVSDGSGADYSSVDPCTAFDSRSNKGAADDFAGFREHGPGNATVYQVAGDQLPVGQGGVVDAGGGVGSCGVPLGASAVLMNFEAVNALQEGNFWVSAGDQSSTGGVLNFNNLVPKMNNANAVVVPLDSLGRIKVEINAGSFTADGTDVAQARGIILGYYN